jgi:5-(carboxyamino)imidazole ribonucleotide mutase
VEKGIRGVEALLIYSSAGIIAFIFGTLFMTTKPLVAIIMGSKSDWVLMEEASAILDQFNIPHEARALSAHRTPDALFEYLKSAEQRGVEVFIAAAGGAAHLPGVVAAKTLLPVLGVPIPSSTFVNGMDALLAIVQMPAGIPVGTLAVGKAGAINAAILAAEILGNKYPEHRNAVRAHREKQAQKVLEQSELKG